MADRVVEVAGDAHSFGVHPRLGGSGLLGSGEGGDARRLRTGLPDQTDNGTQRDRGGCQGEFGDETVPGQLCARVEVVEPVERRHRDEDGGTEHGPRRAAHLRGGVEGADSGQDHADRRQINRVVGEDSEHGHGQHGQRQTATQEQQSTETDCPSDAGQRGGLGIGSDDKRHHQSHRNRQGGIGQPRFEALALLAGFTHICRTHSPRLRSKRVRRSRSASIGQSPAGDSSLASGREELTPQRRCGRSGRPEE